jgi:hypothetical protein
VRKNRPSDGGEREKVLSVDKKHGTDSIQNQIIIKSSPSDLRMQKSVFFF